MTDAHDGRAPAEQPPRQDPGVALATLAVLPTQHSDAFRHWQRKAALQSDEALLQCLAQARECIEHMNHALSARDEAYTRVHLESATHDDDAG